MSSQGVMFSKEVGNSPGLCSVKGQYPVLNRRTISRNQFSSLFLGTDKTPLYIATYAVCPCSISSFFLVAMLFYAFWHYCANGDVVLAA